VPRVSEDHLTARREQIIEAARVCFLTKGLHNTSMQDLIREADLSVGAVYRYFKSKNEIINAIAEKFAGGIATAVLAIADKRLPLAEAMDAALDVIDAQLGARGAFPLAVQLWSEATIDPAIAEIVRERYAQLQGAFVTIAGHAQERGELPAEADTVAVASALFSLMPGYALQRMLIGGPDKETYAAGVATLLSRR
jgi:AcrR family transcriptional regulator